jgi:hypothetical protein
MRADKTKPRRRHIRLQNGAHPATPVRDAHKTSLFEVPIILFNNDAFRIASCTPIQTRQFQGSSNDGWRRQPVLQMEECQALPENLGLVIPLDSEPLPRMERAETLFQFAQEIFIH